jgi:hypothetical protein
VCWEGTCQKSGGVPPFATHLSLHNLVKRQNEREGEKE